MANKTLFDTLRGALVRKTDTRNSAKAKAYALPSKHALAQYAATGCLSQTFYASAEQQLETVLTLCADVEPEFIAKTALYGREKAFLKDVPALLCGILSMRAPKLHERVFGRVIDNARMLRTYVQIMRSGAVGRKSLGTAPKRLVREWLLKHDEEWLFRASVGQSPSLKDIVKMVHPKPESPARQAFFSYLLGRDVEEQALPALVRQFERFKAGQEKTAPDLPLTMLTSLPLKQSDWVAIALNASWQTLRMNLNTFLRHGVFDEPGMDRRIAKRLRDPREIAKARVFPYQLLAAYRMAGPSMPLEIRGALAEAMELAIANVPVAGGQVYVCPDVSGSMQSPVTGYRQGAASSVLCVDVAALVAASILRKNAKARVIPFEQQVVTVPLNARDSVLQNAARLAKVGGGGTNCAAPVELLNKEGARGDLVIFVSDNESWVNAGNGRGTKLMTEWDAFRRRNPKARLVCIDLQANTTTQAHEREDVLNIGGFSDHVFEVISDFAAGRLGKDHWTGLIEAVVI